MQDSLMKPIALRVISMVTLVVLSVSSCSLAFGKENLNLKLLCEGKRVGSKVIYY